MYKEESVKVTVLAGLLNTVAEHVPVVYEQSIRQPSEV